MVICIKSMSRQRFFPPQLGTLRNVRSAADYVAEEVGRENSPFKPTSQINILKRKIVSVILKQLEHFLGVRLLIENYDRELSMFSAESRRLLAELIKHDVISSWDCGLQSIDKPGIASCSLVAGSIRDNYGNELVQSGELNGHGAGETFDKALKVALAELIERISLSDWSSRKFVRRNFGEARKRKSLFFRKQYIKKDTLNNEEINWVKAQNLTNQKQIYIPASMAYLYYQQHYPQEPLFWHTTSNGCAAHVTIEQATKHALLELLERDGFLMYWLNNLAPNRINISDVKNSKIHSRIRELKQQNIKLYILDCHTEYMVPNLAGVLIDGKTGGVYVSASANIDPMLALEKVVNDSMRWGLNFVGKEQEYSGDYKNIHSMNERLRLWHSGKMCTEIDFFLKGKEILYSEYEEKFTRPVSGSELSHLINMIHAQDSDVYMIDLTNRLARNVGLRVVRTIVPDLIPMYFVEADLPIELSRIYSFAQKMGYSDEEYNMSDLNTVPHPFI